MRFVIRDADALAAITPELDRLLDEGVEVVIPDLVADEIGPLPAGVAVVETMLGSRQRNAWELWRRAARADQDAVEAILERVPDVPPEPGDELA